MKKTNKLLSVLLTLALFASLLPFATLPARADAPTSGECGYPESGSVTWTLDGTALTISGTGAMADCPSNSTVPWYGSLGSLASVVIPDSVETIGLGAFQSCTSLTSVVIPDSVETISGSAFQYCTSLASVVIPDSVTTIGTYAFQGCTSLASVVILGSGTSIGGGAFGGCTNLTTVCAENSSLPDDTGYSGEVITPTPVDTWSELYDALNGENTAAYIKLTGDVKFGEGGDDDAHKSDALEVPTNKTILLDLNGHTINRGLQLGANGNALTVNGTLTLIDSGSGGRITGGSVHYTDSSENRAYGGGVCVDGSGSTFTMTGGTISGNETGEDGYGGGVCVENGATFAMSGGTVSGNTADQGGGVYVYGGAFDMSGGAVSRNTANQGGGVCLVGTFILSDGTVSGNTAEIGGGVFVISGTFRVSGAPVVRNNNGNNVKLNGQPIAVTDELTDGAEFWVGAAENEIVAQADDDYKLTDADAEKFHGDRFGVGALREKEGKTVVELVFRSELRTVSVSGGKLTVTVAAPANSTLIAASYDENGRLTGVATLALGGSDVLGESRSLTVPSAHHYRVFLVNGSYAPLCPAAAFKPGT